MSVLYDFTASPDTVWITVNRTCNFRCVWCYAEGSKYSRTFDMTLEKAKEILGVVSDLKIRHVTLTGGEPTLWPYLFEFIDSIHQRDMTCSMITNACEFGNDNFWQKYQKHSCDSLGLSIKGVTIRQFRDITRVPRLYEQSSLGLKRAFSLHDKVDVGTVFSTKTTLADIIAIAERAREYGAKNFTLSPCGITFKNGIPCDDYVFEIEQLIPNIIALYPKLDEIYGENFTLEMSLPFCFWPNDFLEKLMLKKQLASECHVQDRSGLVFDYNGDVLFCNNMLETRIAKFGNDYVDGETLLSFLNGDNLKSQYAELLRYPAECCSICTKRQICRGGCPLNWAVLPYEKCTPILQ